MPHDINVVARIREYLTKFQEIEIEEKKMFGGLAFIINNKMCINVSGQNIMCRFDPTLTNEVSERIGFMPMRMKGKEYKGYCYVEPVGYRERKDLEFWIELCLEFNSKAKSYKE